MSAGAAGGDKRQSRSWAGGVFETRWCWPAQRSPAYASRGRPRGCPPGPRSVVRRRSLSREAAKRHSPGEGGCDGLYIGRLFGGIKSLYRAARGAGRAAC